MIPVEAKVIAEIGTTHIGSMERAKKLIDLAKSCGADYAKFQKRNPDECVPEELKNKPHPNPAFSYGKTYLEHRKILELTIEQHEELFKYCSAVGIKYTTSVWDMTSTREIVQLNPSVIKIPSACNYDSSMFNYLIYNYSGDIHISTGMSSHEEIRQLIQKCMPWSKRIVLYHCTSIYPCPFEKLYLLDIQKFSELKKSGFRIGFSNHGFGIASDIAAWVLGSEYIERHFIDQRDFRHSDAEASLAPEGLRKLCRDLKNVRRAFTLSPSEPDELEVVERKKLRKEQNGN